jgi:hypothetical protein
MIPSAKALGYFRGNIVHPRIPSAKVRAVIDAIILFATIPTLERWNLFPLLLSLDNSPAL